VTSGFVADASVGIAWSVASQASDETERLLDEVSSGRPLCVPVLWLYEVGNALLVLTRRKRIQPQEGVRARRALAALNPVIDETGPSTALNKVCELAAEHGLSVYDGAYLELAARRGLPLASRDAALNRAARRCGIQVLLGTR
jgi:predicted nucleic acid-binding protein